MGTVIVERRKLYEQVWSAPGQQLALLYGISDVGLAKVCRRYNIPRPPRGYWARVAVGQRIPKPPLPKSHPDNELVRIQGLGIANKMIGKIVNHNRNKSSSFFSSGPMHPLVTATREQLLSAAPDHEGLLHTTSHALDVQISSAVVERAISLLDGLVKRWESRDGTVEASQSALQEHGNIHFAIGPDFFTIQLIEKVDESKPLTDRTRLSGQLALHINGHPNRPFRRRWSDTKTQRLERFLPTLVETLLNALTAIREERLDAECIARQKAKVNAIQRVAARDASSEFYLRQDLMQNVDRWYNAQRVRAYLAAIESAVESGKWQPQDEAKFNSWKAWVARFADSIDPIVAGPLPEGESPKPQNVLIPDLDLTSHGKAVIDKLAVQDTDTLWRQSQDTVRKACERGFGPAWNEITRVLEALHYDVSKRERASDWW